MKTKFLFLFSLLTLLTPLTAAADTEPSQTVTIEIKEGTGRWTASTSNGVWNAAWQSTQTDPYVSLQSANGHNNMDYVDGGVRMYTDTGACAYQLVAQSGWKVKSFSFTARPNSGVAVPLTLPNGEQLTVPATGEVQVAYEAPVPAQNLSFTLTGSKVFIVAHQFTVTLVPSDEEVNGKAIFVYDGTAGQNVVYRIPAIVSIPLGVPESAKPGRVVAITDYRWQNGGDVGQGGVDLNARWSDDYGKTWGKEVKIVRGTGDRSACVDQTIDHTDYSYGDPVVTVDRETGKIILLSCSGDIFYGNQTHDHHQHAMAYWSEDGGETWTAPLDVNQTLWDELDQSDEGLCTGFFVGSGGMIQSQFTKVGEHYRLYAAILSKNVTGSGRNHAIYSDDLGRTWHILGGPNARAITGNGNEAKMEELPDGSLLISSRLGGGRLFNIWYWDDEARTRGHWDTPARTPSMVAADCNGEIRIIPAASTATGEAVYLALQSVPMSSSRQNVGIYYKPLHSVDDYASALTIASDWEGSYQVSFLGSAYSAMVLQEDHNIGFLVEEATYGKNYSQVYHNLSIEEITNGRYTYCDPSEIDHTPFRVKRGVVQCRLLWDGEVVSTQEASAYYGHEVQIPALPDYVEGAAPFVMDETCDGSTRDMNLTWSESAPVRIAADAADATYYYLWIKENSYLINNNSAQLSVTTTSYTRGDARAMWAFVGNPFDGFQLVNMKKGVLASADPRQDGNTGGQTYPHAVEEVASSECDRWDLKTSTYYTNGFYLYNHKWGVAMNHRSPYLAYWTGGADAGSTFRVKEVPLADLQLTSIAPLFDSDASSLRPSASSLTFDLSGRRVLAPRRGVYIVDGKKRLIK